MFTALGSAEDLLNSPTHETLRPTVSASPTDISGFTTIIFYLSRTKSIKRNAIWTQTTEKITYAAMISGRHIVSLKCYGLLAIFQMNLTSKSSCCQIFLSETNQPVLSRFQVFQNGHGTPPLSIFATVRYRTCRALSGSLVRSCLIFFSCMFICCGEKNLASHSSAIKDYELFQNYRNTYLLVSDFFFPEQPG